MREYSFSLFLFARNLLLSFFCIKSSAWKTFYALFFACNKYLIYNCDIKLSCVLTIIDGRGRSKSFQGKLRRHFSVDTVKAVLGELALA